MNIDVKGFKGTNLNLKTKQQIRNEIRKNLNLKYSRIVERIKQRAINQYGTEPTITYYYYSCNPVNYAGEENIRASLESICDQGDVVIGDYGSTDNIREIAKEYCARILDVEKTPNTNFFHESKIANKIWFESTSNFMVYLNFNIVYPKNFSSFCKRWLKTHDIKRVILKLIGGIYDKEGILHKRAGMCVSSIIYRPYLIVARGYDERTSYHKGTTEYAVYLLNEFFKLRWDVHRIDMRHRYYTHDEKRQYLNKSYNEQPKDVGSIMNLLKELFNNFGHRGNPFINVQNSYW